MIYDNLNKTWRSGGVDIRTGSDPDADKATGQASNSGGYIGGTGNSGGYAGNPPSSGGNASIGAGSLPYNSAAIQNLLSSIAQLGARPLSGFTNKVTNSFGIQFVGFDGFNIVSGQGYKDSEVLEEQVIAMTSIGRNKEGWQPFDIAILDDEESDVLNILNHQMTGQTTMNADFDMIIEFYDKQGNTTATTYVYGCVIEEFTTDPVNAANPSSQDMKVIVSVRPRSVSFA
ncbi:hypothetical protein D3C75_756520 [compost metagenome]